MLPLLKGMLDCFLSVAFCMVCWRHIKSGCASVGGVVRKARQYGGMRPYKLSHFPVGF